MLRYNKRDNFIIMLCSTITKWLLLVIMDAIIVLAKQTLCEENAHTQTQNINTSRERRHDTKWWDNNNKTRTHFQLTFTAALSFYRQQYNHKHIEHHYFLATLITKLMLLDPDIVSVYGIWNTFMQCDVSAFPGKIKRSYAIKTFVNERDTK